MIPGLDTMSVSTNYQFMQPSKNAYAFAPEVMPLSLFNATQNRSRLCMSDGQLRQHQQLYQLS